MRPEPEKNQAARVASGRRFFVLLCVGWGTAALGFFLYSAGEPHRCFQGRLLEVESTPTQKADMTDVFDAIASLETSKSVGVPSNFYDSRAMTFTHIPKCSGTSFDVEMKPESSEQDCYAHMRQDDSMNVVFLRSPRPHVLSQFNQCMYDGWGRHATKDRNFPRTDNHEADYVTWLRHFLQLAEWQIGPDHDYGCYDPRDVQTRHMSCSYAPNPRANHALPAPPSLERALENLQDADFVGLTDFYHESICMLQLRRTGELKPGCGCENNKGGGGNGGGGGDASKPVIEHAKVTHQVPREATQKHFPEEILEMVDDLTKMDSELFVAALTRFLRDLRVAEVAAGQKIWCKKSTRAGELVSKYMKQS